MPTLEARMRQKRHSDLNWQDITPLIGEIGYDTSTGRTKIGDGMSQWEELPSLGPGRKTIVPHLIEGGVVRFTDGLATSVGDNTLVTYDNEFTANMVGQTIVIAGAGTGGAPHIATVTAYTSPGLCEMSLPAVLEVDGVNGYVGLDQADRISMAMANYQPGDILHLPKGDYLTSWMPDLTDKMMIQGDGRAASRYWWAGTTDMFTGLDVDHVSMKEFAIYGPERSGTMSGISIDKSAHPANFYLWFEDLHVEGFYDGIIIDTPIVTEFARVMAFRNTRYGIDCHGEGDSAGTSVVFNACFTAGNWAAGYHIRQMAYCTLNACAADANGVSYWYQNCPGITENGCGSEETYDFGPDGLNWTDHVPNGLSRYIVNSKVVMNSPYMIGNVGTAMRVFANCYITINSLYEGSPGNPEMDIVDGNNPTISLQVMPEDEGDEILPCHVIISNFSCTEPMDLAPGSTIILSDLLTTGVGFVNHGSTAATPRPSGYGMIIWKGDVMPDDVTGDDIVLMPPP